MTATVQPRPSSRRYVPATLTLDAFADLEPFYRELLDRPIASADELERWVADVSELWAVGEESLQRRYIANSAHTDDPALEAAYLHFVERIEPHLKPALFRLQRKFVDSPHRAALAARDRRFAMLDRKWRAEVELFREQNVPLQTELTKIINEYDKICAAMTVTFRGEERTLQQMARFQEETDRATREEAWRLVASRRLQDRKPIESIFDRLLPIRATIARNADLSDYRAYCWRTYERFDYTPDDCLRFADAIAEHVVPLVREFDRRRRAHLGLAKLRPWDVAVDPKGRSPLRPFEENQVDLFVDRTKAVFARLSDALADQFESLRTRHNLDLDSRRGKQPGGYQSFLPEPREPFIFMNAAGLHDDVNTLLHEGGHAFHTLAARAEPLAILSIAPTEFCEVASMTMEAWGAEHMDVFYADATEAARAKRDYFEGVVRILPWIATIDSFQHWIYTHPGHSRDQRTAEWLRLLDRFGAAPGDVDWTGLEDHRAAMWQRQLHLFHVPFYYVEYGIAQLGALQLWMKSKENPHQALAHYRAALALGGTRPLPDLFAAAGIRFDFSDKTLRPLMTAVRDELDSLPE
jgi:oligoendopeptidase F